MLADDRTCEKRLNIATRIILATYREDLGVGGKFVDDVVDVVEQALQASKLREVQA